MSVHPQTILLVDANDDLREVTAEILESLGFRVLKATRGERALQLFGQNPGAIDYLLAEFVLPGMNGLELADRLLARAPNLGVVILSSHNNHPDLRDRLRQGRTLFLRKPFSVDEIQDKITEAAQHRGAASSPPAVKRRLRRPRGQNPRRAGWLAAAAAVLVFVVAGFSRFGASAPPPLPLWEAGAVSRGSTLEALSPSGVLEEMPRELLWTSVPEAHVYEVTLQRVDQTVLWRTQSSAPRVRLPEALIADLHPRVIYSWRVEALDFGDRRLAGSGLIRFEVIPPNGRGGSSPWGAVLPYVTTVGSSP